MGGREEGSRVEYADRTRPESLTCPPSCPGEEGQRELATASKSQAVRVGNGGQLPGNKWSEQDWLLTRQKQRRVGNQLCDQALCESLRLRFCICKMRIIV